MVNGKKELPVLVDPKLVPECPKRFEWHVSGMKTFMNCNRLFFWRYIMDLQPRGIHVPFFVGDLHHGSLARWYVTRKSMSSIIETFVADECKKVVKEQFKFKKLFNDDDDDNDLNTIIQTTNGMLLGYERKYKGDLKRWPKKDFRAEVQFKVNMGEFDFAGTIDALPDDETIMEHKTVGRLDGSYIDRIALDTQVRGYRFGARHDPKLKLKIREIVYNATRKCKLRKKGKESNSEFLDRIADDYFDRDDFYFWREELRLSQTDVNAFEHTLNILNKQYKALASRDPNDWPCNDHACNSRGMCPFFILCTQGYNIGTKRLFEKVVVKDRTVRE